MKLGIGKEEIGESIIVVGGGFIGCEAAVYIAQMGKEVTLVEMTDTLASGMPVANRMMLIKMLNDSHVNTLTNACLMEITPHGAVVNTDGTTQRHLKTDTIVLALGMRPNSELADALEGRKVSELVVVGDCREPGRIINAIWEGFHAARVL